MTSRTSPPVSSEDVTVPDVEGPAVDGPALRGAVTPELASEVAPEEPLDGAFDAALAGRAQRLVRADGEVVTLATQRWDDDAADADRWFLERCSGPTLDLGCGPGRLVVALAERGVPALGVDVSVFAVRRCQDRGAAVLHRDAFEQLPGEGEWRHVVLADGNIGIGGDPVELLQRCRELLAEGGTVLVELDPTAGRWQGAAQLESDGETTNVWFPWAVLGPGAVDEVAAEAGLAVLERSDGDRCFVLLGGV